MKRFLPLFFILILTFTLSVPAFAAETGTTVPSGETVVVSPDVTVNVTNEASADLDEGQLVGVSTFALNPITPNDATGLKAVLLDLIGDYDAIVVEYSYENTNGYTSYVREIQYDYPWLCACGLFVIVLFCILRGGFAVLCKL